MKLLTLALFWLCAATPVFAQQAVVTKAIDSSTGATTDVGNATDHAIRVTQASGGSVWTFNWTQLLGVAPSATNPMPSRLTDGTAYIDPRSIRLLTSSDVVTVVQGTGSNLHVVVDTAPTTAVTGTFWQATQPISAAALPLPSGAATSGNQTTANSSLSSIDTKTPALGQALAAASVPVILPSATITTLTPPAAITGFALDATLTGRTQKTQITDGTRDGTVKAASTLPALTDTAVVTTQRDPLPAGTNVIGHTIADSGSTTAVTGNVTAVQATGTNLHVVVDSAPTTAVTGAAGGAVVVSLSSTAVVGLADNAGNQAKVKPASTLPVLSDTALVTTQRDPLPAGTNVIGHVIVDTAPTTAVTNAGLTNLDVALSTRTKPADQQHAILDSGTTTVTQATGTNLHVVNDAGAAVIGALVANQSVNHTQINGVTVDAGMGSSSTGTPRFTLAQEPTYGAGMTAATATAAGTGIFWEICGSASKTIRVQKLLVSGTIATGAKNGDIVLTKRSAATTSGTATTLTQVPYDSGSAAGTATNVRYFTVLGTAGTSVGVIQNALIFLPLTGTAALTVPLEFVWRDQDSEAPTLRGTAQCLTLNFGTTTSNAPSLLVSVRWTEK